MNKTMNKTMIAMFALPMSLSLVACGNNSISGIQNNQSQEVDYSVDREQAEDSYAISEASGGGLGNSSVDTSSITNKYTGIAYGTQSETQTLDIYLPDEENNGPYPVIIVYHGGGFMVGSSTGGDVASMLEGVNHGYAVVSVNYRLSGESIFPAAVNDAKAAVRWVKAHAEEYNLDADSIAVWGDSAGGNLAAMVGTTGNLDSIGENDNLENMEYSSSVQAVVDWFGPLDFLAMDDQFEESGVERMEVMGVSKTSVEDSAESKYIGQLITIDPELTQQANPTTYLDTMDTDNAPSFFIQHGTADGNVPTQQSIEFATALTEIFGDHKVQLDLIEGAGHGTSEFDEPSNLDKVFSFLDSVFK